MSTGGRWFSGWIPAELDEGVRARELRRSPRDWVVDTVLFLICLGMGLLLAMAGTEPTPPPPRILMVADGLVGLPCVVLIWWRRRWPVRLGLLMAVLSAFSSIAAVPAQVLLFTVAVRRPLRHVALLAVVNLASGVVYVVVRPDLNTSPVTSLVVAVLLIGAVVAWGLFARARYQLILSLRDRAERAESERNLLLQRARQSERTRIAREMHDVLGHRISLITLHAGALEFRADKAGPEVAESAAVIRASAHQALQDLREVIGVLRAGDTDDSPGRPQPTLCDIPDLIDESRAAGMHIALTLDGDQGAPELIGRTVYRIVQEGLTNARKHAPHTAVTVSVAGGPGRGIDVSVLNRSPLAPPDVLPGAGQGLVGLAERVGLAEGRLEHGRISSGDFRLTAWLPWSLPDEDGGPRDA
ncbi:histidine kinase [Kineosporia mesophila]|uniref:histidine kinase n=1 Tax=Kineosporia mesophila TaxID=566012 RepID=A0ABP7AFZ7_9ACTN|nr:histidine kinase [Kineosporia mesophila]